MIREVPFVVGAALLLAATSALADCSDGACVPGGGPERTDCLAEFRAPRPNVPFFDPTRRKQKPPKEVRCFDGDAGCDVDGEVDGACTFPVDVCVAAIDPALPGCSAGGVQSATLRVKKGDPGTLVADVAALAPATGTACSAGGRVTVALKPRKKGGFKAGKALVKVVAKGGAGTDRDKLKLRCLPREWPTHGYDPRNRRASPAATGITPATVNQLEPAWTLDLGAQVTSTPLLAHGLLYVTAWDGVLYAVNPRNGKVKWRFETGSRQGIKNSAAVTADGRVVVNAGVGDVFCLDARRGRLLWQTNVGNRDEDYVWGAPTVAKGRVFVGIAGDNDNPASVGRLVALDLDTGAPLWEYTTVPERVCETDTGTTCATSADCPDGGACVEGLGAGVTAAPAVLPDGDSIVMNTVGSYTFPSIGDSDSIMRFDAATGAVLWRNRVTPPEQFGACELDSTMECGTSSACGAFGECRRQPVFHDVGFLNGPMLVEDTAGRKLVVSGSKDGSLYALDQETGALVWKKEILPLPTIAVWGLFNGAIGFADGLVYAALHGHADSATNPAKHLKVFDVDDGSVVWEDEIGASWGDVAIAGGVLYTGTQAANEFYAYDAATGTRLRTFDMDGTVAGGAAVLGDRLYIPWGVLTNTGGVQAWTLP